MLAVCTPDGSFQAILRLVSLIIWGSFLASLIFFNPFRRQEAVMDLLRPGSDLKVIETNLTLD